MPIGKRKTDVDKEWEAFGAPKARVYTDVELADFHKKIQKFREEKTLSSGKIVNPLNWDKMAVAFGAYSVTEYQGNSLYRAIAGSDEDCMRLKQLYILWDQYQDWCRRVDWREQKTLEQYNKMSFESNTVELSTGQARQEADKAL